MWLQKVSEMKPEECKSSILFSLHLCLIYAPSPVPLFNVSIQLAAVGFNIELPSVSEQWLV